MKHVTTLVSCSLLALVTGCSADKLDVGASKAIPKSLVEEPEGGSDVQPDHAPPFSAAEIAAADARCAAPHGAVDHPTSITAFKERFVGAWYACDHQNAPWTNGGSGILLVPGPVVGGFSGGGHVFGLAKDGSGGLVKGMGLDMESDFILVPGMPSPVPYDDSFPYLQMTIYPGEHVIEFEAAPRRIRVDGGATWLVPIGGLGE